MRLRARLPIASNKLAWLVELVFGNCPVPATGYGRVVLGHGSGGRLSQQLLQQIVFPQFGNELLAPQHDGALLHVFAAAPDPLAGRGHDIDAHRAEAEHLKNYITGGFSA